MGWQKTNKSTKIIKEANWYGVFLKKLCKYITLWPYPRDCVMKVMSILLGLKLVVYEAYQIFKILKIKMIHKYRKYKCFGLLDIACTVRFSVIMLEL